MVATVVDEDMVPACKGSNRTLYERQRGRRTTKGVAKSGGTTQVNRKSVQSLGVGEDGTAFRIAI